LIAKSNKRRPWSPLVLGIACVQVVSPPQNAILLTQA
jgi:hypothetical protein